MHLNVSKIQKFRHLFLSTEIFKKKFVSVDIIIPVFF